MKENDHYASQSNLANAIGELKSTAFAATEELEPFGVIEFGALVEAPVARLHECGGRVSLADGKLVELLYFPAVDSNELTQLAFKESSLGWFSVLKTLQSLYIDTFLPSTPRKIWRTAEKTKALTEAAGGIQEALFTGTLSAQIYREQPATPLKNRTRSWRNP